MCKLISGRDILLSLKSQHKLAFFIDIKHLLLQKDIINIKN